jgi:hypothetical protein
MTLRRKQDTATQKRTGGEEVDTKGKTPYLEGTMTLEREKNRERLRTICKRKDLQRLVSL